MKKFFILLVGAACFCVIVVSCNKQNGVEVAPTQEKEPISVIDLMEKEEGIKYFKKDVVLRDASGDTEVVLRIASRNEGELNSYLKNYEFTVASVFEAGKDSDKVPDKHNTSDTQPDVTSAINVVTESISVKLNDKAIGYKLGVGLRKSAITEMKKNGRIASYTSYGQHFSEAWPEQVKVTIKNINGGGINSIQIGLEHRWRWFNTWQPFYDWLTLSSSSEFPNIWIYNVDGPWKLKARVYYYPFRCIVCTDGSIIEDGYSVEFLQL